MKRKVICAAFALCCTAAVIFAGCAKDNGIGFTAQYDSNCCWEQDKSYPELTVIRTYEDFISYRNENSLNSVEYQTDYFDGNFVVVIELATSNGAQSYIVNKAVLDDGQLTVHYAYKDPPQDVSGAAVMGEYFLFAGFSNDIAVSDDAVKITNN